MLGLYVSDHPLFGLEEALRALSDTTIGDLIADDELDENSQVTVGGLVTAVQRKVTKKGDSWAVATVEDLEGAVSVMVFPSTYQQCAPLLVEDTVVVVKARVRRRDDAPELHAVDVRAPDLSRRVDGPIVITLPAVRCTAPTVEQLKDVLATHPGGTEVQLRLQGRASTTLMRLDQRLRVTPTSALMADLKALLGPRCLTP